MSKIILDDLARILEQDPDYRVLRRIVPLRPNGAGSVYENAGRAVVVDTETAGLDTDTCEIIELGMTEVFYDKDVGAILGVGNTYSSFNEPSDPITPEITDVTGITDGDVFGAKIDHEEVKVFAAGADMMVAHNAAFDRPVMERNIPELQRLPLAWACSMNEIPWKQLGSTSASLASIAAHFGYFFDAHRAINDIEALAFILTLPGELNETLFGNLMASAQGPMYRVWASGSPFESKNKLKARGYKWKPEPHKTWYRDVRSGDGLEVEWLRANGHSKNPRVESIAATERYRNG